MARGPAGSIELGSPEYWASKGWLPGGDPGVLVAPECSGVIPAECPACSAYASARATMADDVGAAREVLHEQVETVIKGILGDSNTGLSRGMVHRIGEAVTERQSREQRDDAVGRAFR